MRILILILAAAVLAVSSLAFVGFGVRALASAQTQGETPADGARRISPADARAAFDSGKAVIVDVRPLEAYRGGHVTGPPSLPLTECAPRLNELPRKNM